MIYRTIFQSDLVSEYLDLIYQRYILTQPGILANYYSFDPDESVFDENTLSSYGQPGGELSGIKYKVYHNLLLLYGTRVTRQESDSQEKGVNEYETTFQVFLPSVYNIEPYKYDKVGFRPNPKQDIMIYEVSGIEESTLAVNPNYFGWFLTLKPSFLKEDKIQVTKHYAFDTTTNSIVDIDRYNRRLMLFIIADKANQCLRKFYNPVINGWIDSFNTYDSKFGSIIAYSRPIIQQYFKDLTLLYFSRIDKDFMSTWNQFLETHNPEVLNLQSQTPFNPDLIDNDDFETIVNQDYSILDSFILLYRLKNWLEVEYNG